MARRYNLKNIRALLTEGFTEQELRYLCYDELDFKPVHDQLAQNASKAQIIDQLIEYADRKSKIKTLLTLTKEYNPVKYEEHQPYFEENQLYDKNLNSSLVNYNWINIHRLLTEGFTDEELRRLCYDEHDFRPVYDQLARDSGKLEIVDRLLDYVEKTGQVDKLLTLAKEDNPTLYAEYQPYSEQITSPTTENISSSTAHYNLKNIHDLLTHFRKDELRRLCHDERDFRPVFDQLAQDMGKIEIVDRLLDYAEKTGQVDKLLTLAKECNPILYSDYQPYSETKSYNNYFIDVWKSFFQSFWAMIRRLGEFFFPPSPNPLTPAKTFLEDYSNYVGEQDIASPDEESTKKTTTSVFYNPYIAGPPITQPEMFFGRQADLVKVMGLLKNNFVMLTGPRRIGKTSLLHQLAYHLPASAGPEEQLIPVLVNIEGTREAEFFHLLMEEIINSVQKLLPSEILTTLSFDLANSIYPARAFSRDLQVILKSLQATTPYPSRLVLLLDEMDTLNGYSLETQSQLRRIFQRFTNTNLSIAVAGVKLRQHWAGESSPFYNMFIPVTLTPFPEAEARRLITEPVKGRYTYQDEAVTRILAATLGLPHRLQQLCLEVINHVLATAGGRREITAADVDNVLQTIQWLDKEVIAEKQSDSVVTPSPIVAEEREEYQVTKSGSEDQEVK